MTGRNDPCPCGSGKTFKKCCLNKVAQKALAPLPSGRTASSTKDVALIPHNIPKVSLQAFNRDYELVQCARGCHTYARSRPYPKSKWEYWRLTTTYIFGAKQIEGTLSYLVPMINPGQSHEKLLIDGGKIS